MYGRKVTWRLFHRVHAQGEAVPFQMHLIISWSVAVPFFAFYYHTGGLSSVQEKVIEMVSVSAQNKRPFQSNKSLICYKVINQIWISLKLKVKFIKHPQKTFNLGRQFDIDLLFNYLIKLCAIESRKIDCYFSLFLLSPAHFWILDLQSEMVILWRLSLSIIEFISFNNSQNALIFQSLSECD